MYNSYTGTNIHWHDNKPGVVNYDGLDIMLLPWICTDTYEPFLKEVEETDCQVLFGHLELKGKLQSLGVKVHQIQPKSLADILRQSQEIGQILERPKQAKKWLKTSQNKLKQIQVIKEI